jgi:endonuclease/exonuclease/phosphatase family metal-dependent hydrolase
MKRWLLALAFLCGEVWASALTVATYNIENYVAADRMVEGVYRSAYPKPEEEKTALRAVIRGLGPDILALQEMGPQPYLEELQRDLKQEGVDYPYAVVLEAVDPDRHVAVLSKVPFKQVQPHPRVPLESSPSVQAVKRGVLEVTIATDAGDVTVFIIHLKSRRTEDVDDPEGDTRRQREAVAVRDLVLARFPDPSSAKFMICGDWNDTRDSKPVKTLTRRGGTEMGQILAATDGRGESWTHFYHREESYSRIDYILVSAALKPLVVDDCAHVFDGAGVDKASDHRPVFVRLNVTLSK